MLNTGTHGEYSRIVSGRQIWSLSDLVVKFHRGFRVYITSFDSGPLHPTDEESAVGWTTRGGVAISPPLTDEIVIPHDNFYEWYLFDAPNFRMDAIEIFVNYERFTFVDPEESYKSYDPTCERRGLEWLVSVQARFWAQLARLKQQSFVSMGTNDIVVSRNQQFVQCVQKAAEQQAASD